MVCIMAIESALEHYPKAVVLKSGVSLTLRPLVATDYKALRAFFKALPGEDVIFLKERISDSKVIRRWCSKIDYGRTLHLLALANEKIAGLASLNQEPGRMETPHWTAQCPYPPRIPRERHRPQPGQCDH